MSGSMISVSKGFQTSVNIAYDLHDKSKLLAFIPTEEGISLIGDLLESVFAPSSNRAHILIGAYGKGKSHIVLEALNLLTEKSSAPFKKLLGRIRRDNPGLCDDIESYLSGKRKILPVVVNGSSASLSQSFLLALHQTLRKNGLEKYMPDTKFGAAVDAIRNWKENFPKAYKDFNGRTGSSARDFISRLESFDYKAYAEFEKIYPQVTSGSQFNPFGECDIAELYEGVSRKLSASREGWCGLFVVYDEFSKWLESSITRAGIGDIKLLQDFAEKCARSGDKSNKAQLHLLLISHKELDNYIDRLPKEKVDGWRGVSERFRHIVLASGRGGLYQVIGQVIQKSPEAWAKFLKGNEEAFGRLAGKTGVVRLYPDVPDVRKAVCEDCYPLSPYTSYILPLLSERIAQNERTMFTFLSGDGKHSLSRLLEKNDFSKTGKGGLTLITPDALYDYFEKEMRQESHASPVKKAYNASRNALAVLADGKGPLALLQSKLVKTLCLIYAVEQGGRLPPTAESLADIFCDPGYGRKEVSQAIDELLASGILYLRRTNGFLVLKDTPDSDLGVLIRDEVEKRQHKTGVAEILNRLNPEKYLYPMEYNIRNDMTRYFSFRFSLLSELKKDAGGEGLWFPEGDGDGLLLGIINDSPIDSQAEGDDEARQFARNLSKKWPWLCVVCCPGMDFESLSDNLRSLDAVLELKERLSADRVLSDELSMMQEDLEGGLRLFVQGCTRPENSAAEYFADGRENGGRKKKPCRRSDLSQLLSDICTSCYPDTPVVSNEALNRNTLTAAADKAHRILIDAILSSDRGDLGIKGGQEFSFMRSTLVVPGILSGNPESPKHFDLSCGGGEDPENSLKLQKLLGTISDFIRRAKDVEADFGELLETLTGRKGGFAVRKGIIPVYLAVCLSRIGRNVLIRHEEEELPLNARTLCAITENPSGYSIRLMEFDQPREIYVKALCSLFSASPGIGTDGEEDISYDAIVTRMVSWYRALPKFSRERRNGVSEENARFIADLKGAESRSREFLFFTIPSVFKSGDFADILPDKVAAAKKFFDGLLGEELGALVRLTEEMLARHSGQDAAGDLCATYGIFRRKLELQSPGIAGRRFANSAEFLLSVFDGCGGDGLKAVSSLAPVLTGLAVADWDGKTQDLYERRLAEFVETLDGSAGGIKASSDGTGSDGGESYRVSFPGGEKSVSFGKVSCSRKAESLLDEIRNTLDEYGLSVSAGEKREVLMRMLEELC